ncbi:MAG: dimethylargininase [bacterium]|nr:dimethylargininase [bacterium]MCP4968415.1 dimethylargininase [bacterium]
MYPTALIRGVPESFSNALVMGERPAIDVEKARAQHRGYQEMLQNAGYSLLPVAADERYPDCPFVEDAAVILDSLAVITRPGAPERRGETEAMAAALGTLLALRHISDPGTIDGGDVLRVGSTVFVGRSTRTNDAAIVQLGEFAAEVGLNVVAVPVSGVLHLKSAVALLDDETLLIAPDCVDVGLFANYSLLHKAPGETHLASVLRLRSGTLAVTTTAPATTGLLRDKGYSVVSVDSSEFQAADGGLTCLSVLID